jgi:predicted Rossmann fold nucleotide-binding protein DprA/Smf involved in DNA uptake
MTIKSRTIDYIKEKRTVSEEVKNNLKKWNTNKKAVLKSLESESKTIPQITEETGIASDVVTYCLMTLRKYGQIEVDSLDDMDEYYLYKLKGNKNDEN